MTPADRNEATRAVRGWGVAAPGEPAGTAPPDVGPARGRQRERAGEGAAQPLLSG